MQILCGDIGGTNSRLLVAEVNGKDISTISEKSYLSHAFGNFEDVLETFLQEVKTKPEAACFAIAGPVKNGEADITNLSWFLSEIRLREKFALSHVSLINDFSAIGYGVPVLDEFGYRTIQKGKLEIEAPRVILGAGTGLGVAQSIYQNGQWQVLPSQGGHMAFSPANSIQRDLLQWMLNQQDYVSNEDLLSGKGLANLYRYYAYRSNQSDSERVKQIFAFDDPPAVISQYAVNGKDDIATQALNQFVEIYGALAGDLALLSLAYGGVYLAGGIAPKIADQLDGESFLRPFYKKGPMSHLMPHFPVHIIMNERVGLIGAAFHAWQSVQSFE
ncbi:MAG: glucokinase [Nitrosomonas sp.]|nr:glucokinase [Nitrosomonas sp.]